jgi:hypothetical protein
MYIFKGAADVRMGLQFYPTIKYAQVAADIPMNLRFIRL